MSSVLAIVSKAIFERDARVGGRVAAPGEVVPFERYVSKNKGLAPLGQGGALFLVTVRPPNEALWLVGVLESPRFEGEQWVAVKNTFPIVDISLIQDELRFSTGAGISAKKGALGMSLQTPRILTADDVELLRGAAGGSADRAPTREPGHLNAHEADEATPCLCAKCLPAAPERVVVRGMALLRDRADANGRHLHYWLPEAIASQRDAVRRAVVSRLTSRKRMKPGRPHEDLDAFAAAGEDEDEEEDE